VDVPEEGKTCFDFKILSHREIFYYRKLFSNKFYRFNTNGEFVMAGFIDSVLGLFGKKSESSSQHKDSTSTEKSSTKIISEEDYSNIQIVDQVPGSQNISKTDEPDDQYQSITVHGHSIYDPPVSVPSYATSGMTWVGNGQSISVQRFTIHNPLMYWSNNNYPDASCIATSLKVEKPENTNVPSLPYWPQYSGLTPAQRWKYLSWLSQGRNNDLDEIGYAFIFFYGLERRAIIEKKDFDIILDEVNRLLLKYPTSNSFNSYLNQFKAYIIGSQLKGMNDEDIRRYFPSLDNLDERSTKILISWFWSNNRSLQWKLCYSLSKNSPEFQKTNITKKSPDLLTQLFRKKFQQNFPDGIQFISEFEQFPLNYRPASPSLLQYGGYSQGSNFIEPLSLPIPSLSSPPFQTLKKIWIDCIDELKPVVNKLNKTDGSITREVYSLLPDALKDDISHPELELWRNFISSRPPVDGSIILQVSDIAHLIGIEKRNVLTSSQSKTVTSTASDFGWALVPDQTISGTSYKWDDTVALIPIEEREKSVSENFQSAALIFEMAHGIAASDETVTETEEKYLHNFVSEQFSLNPSEITCLKGLQKVLEISPPALSKIGKRLSKYLSPDQKIALANFLGDIVLLDNKFVKEEQKALKTVFKALEINPTVSEELIKKLLIGQTPEKPVTVLKSEGIRSGEIIPPREITPEFTINREKLKQTMEDTRAVQNILASVFEQEQEEIIQNMEPEVKIPDASIPIDGRLKELDLPFPSETIPMLDIKYLSMLHDIMKSNELSQDDFTGLARKHNLMPRAAFDDINTWADEELGDFLLEESESRIIVNYKK